MRKLLFIMPVLGFIAGFPALAADQDVIESISMEAVASYLRSEGLNAQLDKIGNEPVVVFRVPGLELTDIIFIEGVLCDKQPSPACDVIEFRALVEDSRGAVTEERLNKLDEKYELVSIDRVDSTHIIVSDGMVLEGGVTRNNIYRNLITFTAHLLLIGNEVEGLEVPAV